MALFIYSCSLCPCECTNFYFVFTWLSYVYLLVRWSFLHMPALIDWLFGRSVGWLVD